MTINAANDPKRIIIFKTGAIGDVLMSTPFLRSLRNRFPNAQIDYWVGKWAKDVLEGNNNLNNVVSFDHNIFFKKNIFGLISLFLMIKKQAYDIAFVLDKHWIISYFIKLTGIPVRVGFDRKKEGWPNTINVKYGPAKHEIEYYLELAYKVGAKKENDKTLEAPLSKEDKTHATNFILKNSLSRKSIVGLAPAGGFNPGQKTDFRRWPKERYIELCNEILKRKFSIILFGGKYDIIYNREIGDKLIGKMYNVAGKTVKQSIALMGYCDYFITNDSGTMHMASAAGCKVISLFGATDPARKAPLTKGSVAIWKDQKIYEEDYEIYGKNPNKSKRFMQSIKASDVLRHIR